MNPADDDGPVVHVIELAPYRERRRVRGFAFGLLVGYLAGGWVLPALAELAEALLGLELDELATTNGAADRVGAYTNGE